MFGMIDDIVNNGLSVFDGMVSFFTGGIMEALINKTLVATLGISTGDATSIVSGMTELLKGTISFIVSFDVNGLLETLTGPVLETVIGALDPDMSDSMSKITSIISLGLGAIDLVDNFNTESVITLVKDVINEIVGESQIIGETEEAVRKLMAIVKNFKENGLPSVSCPISLASQKMCWVLWV